MTVIETGNVLVPSEKVSEYVPAAGAVVAVFDQPGDQAPAELTVKVVEVQPLGTFGEPVIVILAPAAKPLTEEMKS